ncbi:hypothetical protein [Nitrosovibrio sp. Nv4]|uniref:hypothetical protein n=1 Tax=Nitrosovibrio sp. Nv4 TaxID=1945880 RepID=UPI00117EA11A|nr:hypothetical protein [Nitrosovibrio sp. Nv4]
MNSSGGMVGLRAAKIRVDSGLNEEAVMREKCSGRVLESLDHQAQRLEMLAASLEKAFAGVLRPDSVSSGSVNGSEPALPPMPEFLEQLNQRINSIDSSLDRIQSLIHRSEL